MEGGMEGWEGWDVLVVDHGSWPSMNARGLVPPPGRARKPQMNGNQGPHTHNHDFATTIHGLAPRYGALRIR